MVYQEPWVDDREDKAAYNQSGNITELLGSLLGSYTYYMVQEQFNYAIKVIRRIKDLISGRLSFEEIKSLKNKIKSVESKVHEAMKKHVVNRGVYYTNQKLKDEVEWDIEDIFFEINKLMEKCGYGMASRDDPNMAVAMKGR